MKETTPPKVAHPLARLATRVFGTPLLIQPEKLEVILSAAGGRFVVDGYPVAVPELASDLAGSEQESFSVTPDGIAVIDVAGSLVNRSSWLDAYCGLTSYAQIRKELDAAMASPQVRGVLLRVDSNGGECAGCFDLADAIFAMRGTKPFWAVVDDSAFSAAYMIASAADRVFVSRTGGVGSIGVVATHVDASGWDEKAGLKYTMLTAGAHKKDFNAHEPLSEGARSQLQAEIDRLYGLFVETVARNRGMPIEAVRATEARLYFGERGVGAGLADAVLPFDGVVEQMTARVKNMPSVPHIPRTRPPIAEADLPIAIPTPDPPDPEDPDELEENDMNDTETLQAATPAVPAAPVIPPPPAAMPITPPLSQPVPPSPGVSTPPPASAEEVMELCELAGFDLATARELRSRSLTTAEVRQELLARRTSTAPKGLSSVVLPAALNHTEQMERSAREMAAQTGRNWQQHYAEQLMSNPAVYDQYLAANPAQTQTLS
jgi:signal peptide peptidase SppA